MTVSDQDYPLTAVECVLLKTLMEHPKWVFTKAQLYQQAWEQTYLEDDNSLRVLISRLRDKLGVDHIETIRGIGYRWKL
ncbi:winged helix-turn-helix domain-containing protein [Vaginisenegalia massiliensis]|uniref:winged helix-turn-helix domain-containing protein n=1 Tax=Vaginisenegalia massiliensis TaxID=2058294 RepID=UPI0024060B12|nr:winged helix-turn-helix domain-containing protein [Vaginisenegalia massiliensis]